MCLEDIYAGDEAWQQWFNVCCLDKCAELYRSLLQKEVYSALRRGIRFRRCTLSYSREYLLSYFDEHFRLGGSFEKPKPLKQYLSAKIPMATNGLRGIVCGMIMAGEVKTMARNIKVVEDGAQVRWYTYPRNYPDKKLAGKKVLITAISLDVPLPGCNSGDDGADAQLTGNNIRQPIDSAWTLVPPAEDNIELDKKWFDKKAYEFIELCGMENKSRKRLISAAIIYMIAMKISSTNSVIKQLLEVKTPGGALIKVHKMEENIRKFCKKNDIRPGEIEFMNSLIAVSKKILKTENVFQKLEIAR
jgi:hypothetical protein